MNEFKYCESISSYKRLKTRTVNIGGIPLGGDNPIRLQSMTTTDTMDTSDTVNQSIRMIKSGCEYVRITAPNVKQAHNLNNIKNELLSKGYKTPIIADIHFTPKAAEIAAEIVSKVRINPGNFADRKRFQKFEINDNEYNLELDRIYDKFSPLVKVCKHNGTVMRIGTNHGSLSDRIMNKYGDTPLGMVESALEYIRICEDHNFYDIVLSMKSSNPIIMVNAYRLLVNKMMLESMNYPIHLGVTEAGDGLPGRVKSSLGIGTLLEDGIGDTIRVSLTEEPEFELPVANQIIERYRNTENNSISGNRFNSRINPFEYKKWSSNKVQNIGGDNVPRVIIDASFISEIDNKFLADIGYNYLEEIDKWSISDMSADYIYISDKEINCEIPPSLKIICDLSIWKKNRNNCYPRLSVTEFIDFNDDVIKFLYINSTDELNNTVLNKIKNDLNLILILDDKYCQGILNKRNLLFKLYDSDVKTPVILSKCYDTNNYDLIIINSSIDIGALFVDGFGDGIIICASGYQDIGKINNLSFNILQAARTRITKTEFISCPSCGRTQFDLQKTTARVREKTSHLKGLKIAVMGCIVNGPGEMADADYGYVGTGKNKISLYKGHDLIKSHIDSKDSISELIKLIKNNNDWVDP
mgnify:CR=1 FL=1|tara:strand:- start:1325 stop:3244 length:1920 start_codon:yes stop_codon:yes gene_type:complete